MADNSLIVVFVHGWSVTSIKTYGGLPERLMAAGAAEGIDIQVEEIFLGRYISFHDEVRVPDISRAFRTAVKDQLGDLLAGGRRFICITHSTGGPVIRDWWHRYYETVPRSGRCPMSHLIMLAPANFGSALAHLGKGKVSRLKSWFERVEPGQGVLDWLELGSDPAWTLNEAWIRTDGNQISGGGVFPFVLIGQTIDRKLYDHLNSYTGELGSDGVVRVAGANLNARYIRLEQQAPERSERGIWTADELEPTETHLAPETAMRVVAGKSHSGTSMGIINSVRPSLDDHANDETVNCILRCIKVTSKGEYRTLTAAFATETGAVQKAERVEEIRGPFRRDRVFVHDRYSMVIFRVIDHQGYPVTDFDLVLTAGRRDSEDHLPEGFFVDRQLNGVNKNTVSYYLDHDVMKKSDPIVDKKGAVVRPASPGADRLGFKILPRPRAGFVHYLPGRIAASEELLEQALQENGTTMIEIVLQRVVRRNVFRVDRRKDIDGDSFKGTKPGPDIAE